MSFDQTPSLPPFQSAFAFHFPFFSIRKGLGLVSRSNLPAFVATLPKVLILLTWAFTFCLLKVNRLV